MGASDSVAALVSGAAATVAWASAPGTTGKRVSWGDILLELISRESQDLGFGEVWRNGSTAFLCAQSSAFPYNPGRGSPVPTVSYLTRRGRGCVVLQRSIQLSSHLAISVQYWWWCWVQLADTTNTLGSFVSESDQKGSRFEQFFPHQKPVSIPVGATSAGVAYVRILGD
jgi:hypothetical protein